MGDEKREIKKSAQEHKGELVRFIIDYCGDMGGGGQLGQVGLAGRVGLPGRAEKRNRGSGSKVQNRRILALAICGWICYGFVVSFVL